jgi:hypothetical protein
MDEEILTNMSGKLLGCELSFIERRTHHTETIFEAEQNHYLELCNVNYLVDPY